MGFKLFKKSKSLPCNICEEEMDTMTLFMCPNCKAEGDSEICPNCESEMNEVEILYCPNCGNTIDEEGLKKKWELKKKFEKLT